LNTENYIYYFAFASHFCAFLYVLVKAIVAVYKGFFYSKHYHFGFLITILYPV